MAKNKNKGKEGKGRIKYAILTPFRPAIRALLKRRGVKTSRKMKNKELAELFAKHYPEYIKKHYEYIDESGEYHYEHAVPISPEIIIEAVKKLLEIFKKKGDNIDKDIKEEEEKERKKGKDNKNTGTYIAIGIGGILLIAVLFAIFKK